MGTPRVLLGQNANNDYGLWVTKPGVDASSVGLEYGWSEEFIFTGTSNTSWGNTFYYGWGAGADATAGAADPSTHSQRSMGVWSCDNGGVDIRMNVSTHDTLKFWANNYDPFIVSPNTYSTEFIGANYPILEMNVRRNITTAPDTPGAGSHSNDLQLFFEVSNTNADGTPNYNDTGWNLAQVMNLGKYDREELFPDSNVGKWNTIVWDFTNPPSYDTTPDPYTGTPINISNQWAADAWTDNSHIKRFRIDFTYNWKVTSESKHEWEIASVRIKKASAANNSGPQPRLDDILLSTTPQRDPDARLHAVFPASVGGVANNTGEVAEDPWLYTGVIHATGIVQAGIAPAWANGDSGPGLTSDPMQDAFASPSYGHQPTGRVNFPELPYIPVVVFHRYDANTSTEQPSNIGRHLEGGNVDGIPARIAHPGGAREYTSKQDPVYQFFSADVDDATYHTHDWYSAYLHAKRTFASARISKDHFDLHIRHGMARESNEWMTNHMIHDVENLSARLSYWASGAAAFNTEKPDHEGEAPTKSKWMIESWRPGWGAYGMSRLDATYANTHDHYGKGVNSSNDPGNYGSHLWEKGKNHFLGSAGNPIQYANTENIGTPHHYPHGLVPSGTISSDWWYGNEKWPCGSPRAIKHMTAYIPHGEPEITQLQERPNATFQAETPWNWNHRWQLGGQPFAVNVPSGWGGTAAALQTYGAAEDLTPEGPEMGTYNGTNEFINKTSRWYEVICDNEMRNIVGTGSGTATDARINRKGGLANGIFYPSGVVPTTNVYSTQGELDFEIASPGIGTKWNSIPLYHYVGADIAYFRSNNFPSSTGQKGTTPSAPGDTAVNLWRANRANRNASHMYSHHNYIATQPENAPYYRYYVYRIPAGLD